MFTQINGADDGRTPVVSVVGIVSANAPLEEFASSSVPRFAQKDGAESPTSISRSIERTAKDNADVIVAQTAGKKRGVEQLENLTEVREA